MILPSQPRQRGAARLLAAGLALSLLVAQLASLAHAVTVTHVTCAEHGEAVEIGRPTGGEAHRHDAPCVAPTDDAHHEHCALVSYRRERAVDDASPAARAISVLAPPLDARPDRSTPPPSIPLLLLAPKSSPPV